MAIDGGLRHLYRIIARRGEWPITFRTHSSFGGGSEVVTTNELAGETGGVCGRRRRRRSRGRCRPVCNKKSSNDDDERQLRRRIASNYASYRISHHIESSGKSVIAMSLPH
jgi:hypothetical protein